MRGFNYKKSAQALAWFAANNEGNLNKMKALKLMWLSDRCHVRKYGRTLTGDIYFALPNGPVASSTRDILEMNSMTLSETELEYVKGLLEKKGAYSYAMIGELNLRVFSKTDVEILTLVQKTYGHLDHFKLSELSHVFPEWKQFEAELKRTGSRYRISIPGFFVSVEDGYGLFSESEDFLSSSKEIYAASEALSH
jgi:uncharacterized phage-associated protein